GGPADHRPGQRAATRSERPMVSLDRDPDGSWQRVFDLIGLPPLTPEVLLANARFAVAQGYVPGPSQRGNRYHHATVAWLPCQAAGCGQRYPVKHQARSRFCSAWCRQRTCLADLERTYPSAVTDRIRCADCEAAPSLFRVARTRANQLASRYSRSRPSLAV